MDEEREEPTGQEETENVEGTAAEESTEPPEGVTRRRFMKWAVVGGIVAAAAGIGGYAALHWGGNKPALPSYFVNANTVDYSMVPDHIEDPTLHVAQWYQYWPSSFLDGFKAHIQQAYGISVNIVQEIYTSNEELFTWITQSGKKFDVMFPSNYTVETMERAGLILNMNPGWLTNYGNLFDVWKYTAPQNVYARRSSSGAPLAVPYQWGTTGIGFRTDKGWTRADIEADGYEVFWKQTYKGQNVTGKMMMLDDMRETLWTTYKRIGWNEQVTKGYTPTNIPQNPDPPYNGEYQWSQNETDAARLSAAKADLLVAKGNIFDFNTQNQGPYLVQDIVWIDTAWSGDIMYAIRPNTASPLPVDYWVPMMGGAQWTDNVVIHKESRNLFLAHEFIDFFLDAQQGANITDWNLYATPNKASFDLLKSYPQYGWNPREDPRIYGDYATGYTGPSILQRSEPQHDLGANTTQDYLNAWSQIKFA